MPDYIRLADPCTGRGQIFKNLVLAKVSGMSRALAYFREGAVYTERRAHL